MQAVSAPHTFCRARYLGDARQAVSGFAALIRYIGGGPALLLKAAHAALRFADEKYPSIQINRTFQ